MSEHESTWLGGKESVKTERQELLFKLRHALEDRPFIHSVWLEGADARGQADDFSDIDLWLDVEPGFEEEALALVRGVVESFGPLTVNHVPEHPDPIPLA